MSEAKPLNPFESLKGLSAATRKLRIAKPDDVVGVRRSWPAEELRLKIEHRGPARIETEVRDGAELMEFEIRGLSFVERQEAERMVERVMPPKKTRQEIKPGFPPMTVDDGFDDLSPQYLADREAAQAHRLLYIVLKGVVGMEASIEGTTAEDKMKGLSGMSSKVIEYLAGEVWHFSFSAGETEDFFFSKGSASIRS